ncbi:MAG: Uroporphyrinogen synthase [Planctomycetaceae bacterium]|nr:Uroporphyrinogen synthase [Planctomycetaceae bacterium]
MTSLESQPLRVCAFESRRAADIRSLIDRQGGITTNAPSMREIPLEQNPAAFQFAEDLLRGRFDIVIFLTGVGARGLLDVLETRHSRADLFAALNQTIVVLRGPKPAAVFREWQLKFDYQVREPNTWRELLELIDTQIPVQGKRVAIQEYGLPSKELVAGLQDRGAEVVAVPVYRWDLPENTEPLQDAIRGTIAGEFDVLMWTSSFQLTAVLQVAESLGLQQAWLDAAKKCVIASVGPAATENLLAHGLPPDVEPEHPKMGHLVKAALEQGREILAKKQQISP